MNRERLPNRRYSENLKFRCWGVPFHATVGRYADGRIGEVFLNAGKLTSNTDVAAKESAIALSFALQYGAPLEKLKEAMPRTSDGAPEGPLGHLLDMLVAMEEVERQPWVEAAE